MKNVRTTHFSFVFSKFFNLWREQFLCGVGDREPVQAKVTVEKTPKRAGATPLFRLSAAQKVRGVAPAHTFARNESFWPLAPAGSETAILRGQRMEPQTRKEERRGG